MKTNAKIKTALEQDHAIQAIPEVIVDWNFNRYYTPTADNTPKEDDEGYDVELFPIESIVANNRPRKGINKARIGTGSIGEDYQYNASGVRNGRYYITDVDDTYKYWTSPNPSNNSGAISNVSPQVIYNVPVKPNKIAIKTENSWATAKTFSIQVTTQGTQWTEIANQNTVGNGWKPSGEIVLYYQGTGSSVTNWTTGPRKDKADGTPQTVQIRGVRMVVTALETGYKITRSGAPLATTYKVANTSGQYTEHTTTGANSFFDLIEISARLEADLSPHVISYSTNMDMGEASQMYPIGTVSSNQSDVVLSNLYVNASGETVPGLFSRYNADSPYHNFIEANAKMTCFLNYYDEDESFLGKVQEFEMYADGWSGQTEDEVQVALTDYSKFFDTNEATLRAAMWEGLTVPQIIWRILDSIGFTNYEVDVDSDYVTSHTIPVFYTTGEQTVWEVLDELSKASQTAIYFDAYGVLQVKTRDFAFKRTEPAVWDFSAVDDGDTLSNIVNMSVESEFEPNHYKVTYQTAKWSPSNRGQPSLQQVWTPEAENVVLRATPLVRTMEKDDMTMFIGADDVALWPYEGIVNVQGELMRFKGKTFVYYIGNPAVTSNRKTMVIDSDDDYKARNSLTPLQYRHNNHFTGGMKITERGLWNSENKRHPVEAEGYAVHQNVDGTYKANVGGFVHYKARSRVEMTSNFSGVDDIKLATRGSDSDANFYNYGTRFRILKDSSRTTQAAGLVIHNSGNNENGYFFDFTPTNKILAKSTRKELAVYSRIGGKLTMIGQARPLIVENFDYEVDISFQVVGGNHLLNVWVNGKNVFTETVSGSNRVGAGGKFGMFVAGSTRAEFEYLYAIRREEESPMLEDFSFMDKVETGYMGGQWDREWVYRWRDAKKRPIKKWKKGASRFNRTFFDEFGPIVHELREFEVKFDPNPIQHSRLYITNDWSAICTEYASDPFGAKFVVANTSRRNAVIHGEDTLSFSGTGESITQVFTVWGRPLIVEDGEEVIAENVDQIRRRGKVESEISSTWIQSKKMAQDIANWLKNTFSYGNEQAEMEVFGNPLIEIGDVVTVNYPDKHITGSFFVMGIRNDFSNGLSTSLTLRRRAS